MEILVPAGPACNGLPHPHTSLRGVHCRRVVSEGTLEENRRSIATYPGCSL